MPESVSGIVDSAMNDKVIVSDTSFLSPGQLLLLKDCVIKDKYNKQTLTWIA